VISTMSVNADVEMRQVLLVSHQDAAAHAASGAHHEHETLGCDDIVANNMMDIHEHEVENQIETANAQNAPPDPAPEASLPALSHPNASHDALYGVDENADTNPIPGMLLLLKQDSFGW
jgi:hypothetical protein